jgi:hypothetical protein
MTQREQFEAWARKEDMRLNRIINQPDDYAFLSTLAAWRAWQAAQAAQPAREPLSDDQCRDIYNAAMELPNRSAVSVMRYIESKIKEQK